MGEGSALGAMPLAVKQPDEYMPVFLRGHQGAEENSSGKGRTAAFPEKDCFNAGRIDCNGRICSGKSEGIVGSMNIPHNRPTVGKEETEAVSRVISASDLAQGVEAEAFENDICDFLGLESGHAAVVSSGSAALYMAIRAIAAARPVVEIAIPAYSCSALRNAVLLAGKRPLYADTGKDSPNIDMESDDVRKSSLAIVCHMYGRPVKILQKQVIEDCAHAIGAAVEGCPAGIQAEIGVFSFYATKLITSGGEGGAVVSRNKGYIDYIKDLRDFDMKNDTCLRFNMKMTDLQAAFGRIQLKKLPGFIQRRRYLADRYEQNGIPLWKRVGGIEYRALVQSRNPEKLAGFLRQEKVCAILPVEEKELLCSPAAVPNAWKLTKSLVSIPLYPSLTDEQQNIIIGLLNRYKHKEGHL